MPTHYDGTEKEERALNAFIRFTRAFDTGSVVWPKERVVSQAGVEEPTRGGAQGQLGQRVEGPDALDVVVAVRTESPMSESNRT